jgi:putative DNA primase/helicase
MSAFGNPHKLIGSFNSTIVGLERMAAALRNLPFAIDELQVLNTKRMSTDSIIYMLSQGQGRTRGSKDGGLQETLTWRNIIITTGEEALLGGNMQDGANTRTFELYTKPVEDTTLASLMHEVSEAHYGFAGEVFVKKLCEDLKKNKAILQALYDEIKISRKEKYLDCIHIDEVAVVCLGDYLSSIYVFEEDEKIAMKGALKTSIDMLENNRQLTQNDNIERAFEMFTGWLIANSERFSFDAPSPRYGRIDQINNYLVIPSFANKALEDAGFSPKKVFRGFAERGYIESQVDSEGIMRLQMAKSICGKTCRVYVVRVPEAEIDKAELDFLG